MLENHDWSEIMASPSAPYIRQLVTMGAHAEQYFNPPGLHPSEPNYLWLESGSNFGIADDNDPAVNAQSTTSHLVTMLEGAGHTWKSYQEDIPGTDCPLSWINMYGPKHDPMVFFRDVTNNNSTTSARCISHVRPFSELAHDLAVNDVADYNFITPNACNDMHSACAPQNDTIKQGNDWLATAVPMILGSTAMASGGVVLITWDESENNDGPIGMIALGKNVNVGHASTVHFTHSSTLRTVEEIFGLSPFLGDSANATDLADLFTTMP